ncbi:MAG: hypothetical protein ACTSU7_00255 [Candidatus Heimdallarchaeaceae archaeon]
MSKIDDLISPRKEVEFRGEKFTIEAGFNLEEAPTVASAFGGDTIEGKADGLKKLLKIILRRLYPDATEEQLSKVDLRHSDDLLGVFSQIDDTEKENMAEIKKTLEVK